ncbi:MAG: hypothetical protein GX066_09230 [Clostridiaceae bacterium]|nr:hypothetical protein [Clostridiaceae bacterium]
MTNFNPEQKLSDYIDALNEEQEPEKKFGTVDDEEIEKLLKTARLLRSLKEAEMPDQGYPQRLAKAIYGEVYKNDPTYNSDKRTYGKRTTASSVVRRILPAAAALAAGLIIFAVLFSWSGLSNKDVVYAMEKAINRLYNYHGILEMRSRNAEGKEWLVRRAEIWTEGEKYAIKQSDGTLTVNNGEQKWQVSHQDKEVAILPLVPDPTRNSFDLRDEAKRAREYPHEIIGSEIIAGRETTKVKISPPGGLEYYLWVDSETNLPIQLETAMQNALQTTYTFVSFEPNTEIDAEIFDYKLPEGYRIVNNDPGQQVATIEEAAAISRFTPLLTQEPPARIFAFKDRIVLDYGDTTIVESTPGDTFEPVAGSALGTAAGNPLEVWQERLRWRQDGIEIQVEGPKRVELARQIAGDLSLPDTSQSLVEKAKVKVPVDEEVVKANQQQVDRGSSPWQLDPLQVSLTFVNLMVTPEGIQGEPQISMPSFKIKENNSVEAVVEVSDGPIKQVYLKRLIRQDETGIWTVVGYDPR